MQHLRHPAPAACRAGGPGAGGGVAARGTAAGPEPAPVPAAPQNTALCWSFPGSALDVSLSRRWLAAAVEQAWGAGDDADRVVLAYSEVATNAVVHGAGPVTVRARIRDAAVTCEVADCSLRAPQHRHATGEDVCGRGLDLVVMTVDRFRVDVGEAGKTVAFEVGRRPGTAAGSGRSPLARSGAGPVASPPKDEAERGFAPEAEPVPEFVPALEPELEPELEPALTTEPGPGSRSGTGLRTPITPGAGSGSPGAPPSQGVGGTG